MVFAAIFRQKTRKEGREQGREEGRATGIEEADAAWREWNQRRLQAMADGMPFDEPTPDFRVELIQRALDVRAKPRP